MKAKLVAGFTRLPILDKIKRDYYTIVPLDLTLRRRVWSGFKPGQALFDEEGHLLGTIREAKRLPDGFWDVDIKWID